MIMQVITTTTKPSVNKMKNIAIYPLVRDRAAQLHCSTTLLEKSPLEDRRLTADPFNPQPGRPQADVSDASS
jgi:hypothetical protein